MKALYTAILWSIALTSGLHAQSPEDSAVYNPGLRLMERAKTLEDYLGVARYFEKLATRYPEQWLALYYEGLSYLHASYRAEGNSAKDEIIDKAQPAIDQALKLKPGEPEIYVLQAFLYQSRLQVNPELRGLTYSQKAEASIKKAVAVNPSNPRAYFLLAYNIYYTPAFFGGGAKNALSVFIKAKEKYLAFKPVLPFYPDWGEKENQQMIIACKNELN